MTNSKIPTPQIFWIDLFCGAGGTSTGISMARSKSKVIACVNHDANAIKSHLANHPNCKHFTEDIKDFAVVLKIKKIVDKYRAKYPDCYINVWASLECTNYSKAKGGLPRDADSRTLAQHLFMYVDELSPDYLHIENVREFMSWGPLDITGKPISRDKGKDYQKWIDNICKRGYHFDYAILNSADYGAYTSRERYFSQFAKKGLPIEFPKPTHVKKINKTPGLFDEQLPVRKPVKEVLDLTNEGESIFDRKKPYVEATYFRILAGCKKFVPQGQDVFRKRYNGGMVNVEEKTKTLNEPMGTILGNNTHAIVKVIGLKTYYGNGYCSSVEKPCPTLTTKDRVAIVYGQFLDQQYSNSTAASIDEPANTLTTVPKLQLVTAKFLFNPQFNSAGSSIEKPCFTLIARMDKRPPYIVTAENGSGYIVIYENDSPAVVQLKEFMAEHGIIDIKMRMLTINEMLTIQGFPKGYKLIGTQTQQKKYIGNSVVPLMAQKIVESNYNALLNVKRKKSKAHGI